MRLSSSEISDVFGQIRTPHQIFSRTDPLLCALVLGFYYVSIIWDFVGSVVYYLPTFNGNTYTSNCAMEGKMDQLSIYRDQPRSYARYRLGRQSVLKSTFLGPDLRCLQNTPFHSMPRPSCLIVKDHEPS